tara:strand:+ start:56 stop:316 length:261 start_codon:yes stop_codon:yes gene_type:complete
MELNPHITMLALNKKDAQELYDLLNTKTNEYLVDMMTVAQAVVLYRSPSKNGEWLCPNNDLNPCEIEYKNNEEPACIHCKEYEERQ